MRILGLLFLIVASGAVAQDASLIGAWKLLSFQTILDNEPPTDLYGARPKGVLIFTPEGRMASIVTGENRKAGTSDAERAELHKTLVAYSGKYHVEGREFVTAVDTSWNEVWNGTEQRRYWRVEDGKLFLETPPIPSPKFPCPYRKLNPDIMVVQSAENRLGENAADGLDGSRHWRVLDQ